MPLLLLPLPAVAHLGVVAGENLERDGRDELADEVQPLAVEADLLHVDVVRRHRLVAAGDPLVLGGGRESGVMVINDVEKKMFPLLNTLINDLKRHNKG